MGFILVFHEDLVRTSQRRLTVTTRLILCRERVGVYCKSRSEHTTILPGQNEDFSVGPVGSLLQRVNEPKFCCRIQKGLLLFCIPRLINSVHITTPCF